MRGHSSATQKWPQLVTTNKDWCEKRIPDSAPHPSRDLENQNLGAKPSILRFNRISRKCVCTLKFENHQAVLDEWFANVVECSRITWGALKTVYTHAPPRPIKSDFLGWKPRDRHFLKKTSQMIPTCRPAWEPINRGRWKEAWHSGVFRAISCLCKIMQRSLEWCLMYFLNTSSFGTLMNKENKSKISLFFFFFNFNFEWKKKSLSGVACGKRPKTNCVFITSFSPFNKWISQYCHRQDCIFFPRSNQMARISWQSEKWLWDICFLLL